MTMLNPQVLQMPFLDDLTVFIISTGEDTAADCEKALMEQDCTFTIKHIKNTFPMSRAFQRMPDECETGYFVQVDSDMILKPHAIRTLYNGIKKTSFITYMVYGQLYEEGFGVGGSVRCWKRGLFKFFKFRDCRTVDRDLYRRVHRIGLRAKNLNQVLGIHRARHSPFSNYLKTKSDVEKWRFLDRAPEDYALDVLKKNISNLPESSNELLGSLLGALTAKERLIRSKDIHVETERYHKLLNKLGINGNHIVARNTENHTHVLEVAFCRAYRDMGDSHTSAKYQLASLIIEIFGSQPHIDAEDIIKLAAQ
jgi:hypothetical protein